MKKKESIGLDKLVDAQSMSFNWHPGDVIFDLYEVRKITENLDKNTQEKDYHEGGFAKIYKVWHRTWQREIAVKVPLADLFTTKKQKDTFVRECETWINLGLHPHIVECYYVREWGGVPRIFSEYADAGSLEDWIRSHRLYEGDKRNGLKQVLDCAIQFAWGLHYSHERGVIHQDVKPLNALMWKDGTLKVNDFGLVKAQHKAGLAIKDTGKLHTIMASSGGMTPAYCSPEQADGSLLDRRTDLWSWAVSVLEMFQGKVTWQSGIFAAEALEQFIANGGKEEGIPAMPAGVADLLRQCFQYSPKDRPLNLRFCALRLCEVYYSEIGIPYPRSEPNVVGDTPDGLNNRGLSMLDLDKIEEAETFFNRALKLDKHHLTTTYNLGLLRWRTALCTDADILLSLKEIKKEHPNEANVEYALGLVRMEDADFTNAQSHIENAIVLGDTGEAQKCLNQVRSFAQEGSGNCFRTLEGHTGSVYSVAFSNDGHFALSGGIDRTLRLWEIETGQCLRTFEGHERGVRCVAFSPDGRFALSGGRQLQYRGIDNLPRLWDITTGQCLRTFKGHESGVRSVVFSPDGRFALSGGNDQNLKLWDLGTGKCLRTFTGHSGYVNSVAFSPDGRFALSGSSGIYTNKDFDNSLRLWDVVTGKCINIFEENIDSFSSVAFSPDGNFALSGGNKVLKLWHVSTGKCLRIFSGHISGVNSVAFSPDGRFALSGSGDNSLRLWEIGTGKCLRTFEGHIDSIYSVAFSPEGSSVLSSSGDTTLKLWNILPVVEKRYISPWLYSMATTVNEVIKRQHLHESLLSQAHEHNEAGRIADALFFIRYARTISGFEKSLESLELQAKIGSRARIKSYGGGWLKNTIKGYRRSASSILFSPSGYFALSGSFHNTFQLWDVAKGKCLRTFRGHSRDVTSLAFSPNQHFALSGSMDKTLRLWDVTTGQCLRILEGHTDRIGSVVFSPDGNLALSGSNDMTLRLWDVTKGLCLRTFEGHKKSVRSVVFSPDGNLALSGGWDDTLRIWNVATGKKLHTIKCWGGDKRSFSISPDGRFILLGSKNFPLRLFDIFTGECQCTFEGHPGDDDYDDYIVFSPNGRFALSRSFDTLRLWDIESGKCLRTFEGHTKSVISIAFSPNGRFALSGSFDNTLRLWDIESGKCLRTFEGHTHWVTFVTFTPDVRFALSGSSDGSLRLWEIDWEYEKDPMLTN